VAKLFHDGSDPRGSGRTDEETRQVETIARPRGSWSIRVVSIGGRVLRPSLQRSLRNPDELHHAAHDDCFIANSVSAPGPDPQCHATLVVSIESAHRATAHY
jgi:hypothetical protein